MIVGMRRRSLAPVKSGSLRQQVKEAIRGAIFQGRFQPGDPMRELDLARDLRVSQATVREALLELEQAGLVHRIPNKETTVTKLSRQELIERNTIRTMLEIPAAIEASQRMTETAIAALQARLGAISSSVAGNDYGRVAEADLEFHRYIWEQSGNRTLCTTLLNITAPIFAFASILRSIEHEDLPKIVHGHEPIVEAIRSRDPKAVELSIHQHIEGSYEAFLSSDWEDFNSFIRYRRLRSIPTPAGSVADVG